MNAIRSERLTWDSNACAETLAQRCLDDSGWLMAVSGETEVIRAMENMGLLMSDPCEYGNTVRSVVEKLAKDGAEHYLKEDPSRTHNDKVCRLRVGPNQQWWERIV